MGGGSGGEWLAVCPNVAIIVVSQWANDDVPFRCLGNDFWWLVLYQSFS